MIGFKIAVGLWLTAVGFSIGIQVRHAWDSAPW